MDPSVTVKDITVSPSLMARNLGIIHGDRLSCTPNIIAVAQSFRFALYNIGRTRSFLTKDARQLLAKVLVISCLDCCYSFLAELSASASKLLLHI